MFSKKTEAKFCPLIKKACKGSECMWSTTLRGNNPNTGEPIDEEACAVSWMPLLMTENVQATHQAGAAVESLRNESVKNHTESMAQMVRAKLGFPASPKLENS